MDNDELVSYLKEREVLQTGHFVTLTGDHTDVFLFPQEIRDSVQLSKRVILGHIPRPWEYVCVGASKGATRIIRNILAPVREMTQFVFPKIRQGEFLFTDEDLERLRGSHVVLIDDVVRKGGRILELTDALHKELGDVIAPQFILTMLSAAGAHLREIPVKSVISTTVNHWRPEHCHLCERGIEAIDPYEAIRDRIPKK